MTLDDLMKDLETAKNLAIENKNPNALVSATIAQAKLLGLDRPKAQPDKNAKALDLMRDFMRHIEND